HHARGDGDAQGAVHQPLARLGAGRVYGIGVDGVPVAGNHREHRQVGLGDGAAPALEALAGLEVFVVQRMVCHGVADGAGRQAGVSCRRRSSAIWRRRTRWILNPLALAAMGNSSTSHSRAGTLNGASVARSGASKASGFVSAGAMTNAAARGWPSRVIPTTCAFWTPGWLARACSISA